MSAGGSGAPTSGAVSSTSLLVLGIVGGLLGIYLSGYIPILGPTLACLGSVCAIIWGADAIRRVASYGLGTGVPSIGYMCLSVGVIGAIAGLILCQMYNIVLLSPIVGLIISMIFGLIIAIIAKKIIGMKIPILERCTLEISGAAALSLLGFMIAIGGTTDFSYYLESVVGTGFIAVLFIMNTMAIQHPYNACLGPNENQVRTLKCACSTAFLAMTVTGLMAIYAGGVGWVIVFIIGLIGWIISFNSFVKASYNAAASVKWSGLWPKVEE